MEPKGGYFVSRREWLILLNAAKWSSKTRAEHCPLDLASKPFLVPFARGH